MTCIWLPWAAMPCRNLQATVSQTSILSMGDSLDDQAARLSVENHQKGLRPGGAPTARRQRCPSEPVMPDQ